MKHSISLGIWILLATASAHAQSVNFTIDTQKDTLAISPYIYGSNGQSDDTSAHVTARRLGGNRLTGYNWENNASNAGTDYLNHSDNYLTFDLANSLQNTPAIVPIQFHQESQKEHAYSLVTLPAAGYVARDKSGTVAANEVAPSKRWCQVVFSKQAPFDAPPDTTDNFVYDNEEVHYLIGQLGSSDKGGIQGYDCDNEPALWPSTHPRIHPSPTTCAEVIARDSALAVSVKSVDPKAEIFGPVSYGFAEFTNNQTAADWSKYQSYGRWIDAYLAKMHDASTIVGKRLLDVLDLHWYPEAQGIDAGGKLTRITPSGDTAPGIARARMDAPRTLWDSTYKENSWIAQYFSPVALLPWLNAAIKKYYPGTKLSFSELNYGGETHISGAIAIADVLGIFGRYNVYMSNYWGTVGGYIASAYKIYRNYDGAGSTFGNIGVHAATNNVDSTSVYAATRSTDGSRLDIILINKSLITALVSTVTITSPKQYLSAGVFVVQKGSPFIVAAPAISAISNNRFNYSLPPLSVTHLVLQAKSESVASAVSNAWSIRSADAGTNRITIDLNGRLDHDARVSVIDILGRERAARSISATSQDEVFLSVTGLSDGVYLVSVVSDGRTATYKLVVNNR